MKRKRDYSGLREMWEAGVLVREIADHFNVSIGAVQGVRRRMGLPNRGEGAGARGKPITIRGVTYPSQRAAAKALGLADATISQAKDEGRLDLIGTDVRAPHRGVPVEIGGVEYVSNRDARRHTGLSWWKVKLISDVQRERRKVAAE